MRFFIACSFVVLSYVAVSTADFSDAIASEGYYCSQVEAGAWPDYKGTFDKCP